MKRLLCVTLLLILCIAVAAACTPEVTPVTTAPVTVETEAPQTTEPEEITATEEPTAPATENPTETEDPVMTEEPTATAPTEGTTAKPTTVKTTVKTTAPASYSKNAIEFYGRFKKSADGWQFDWSGSAIEAGFEGTGIELQINVLKSPKDYLNVYIDGGEPTVLEISNKNDFYTLASGLKKGYHTVRIEKRTEGGQGALCEFVGFDVTGGKLTKAPARPARKIEVYGDSLTVGQGIEGTFGDLTFHLPEENAGMTYGMLTAKALGASCTVIGQGGIGIYANYAGDTTNVISSIYDHTLWHDKTTVWDFSEKPDVVLICIGSNDGTARVSADNQYEAYLSFLDALRAKYADTTIVLFSGAISWADYDPIQRAVKVFNDEGDDRVFCTYLSYPGELMRGDEEVTGGFGHPNVKANQLTAEMLTAYLKTIMNW